ncbi:hypothetical protein DICVIV_14425 [Dictyocaulus viviparus]|uniref:Uncharacterized protein n=1 Tax=Dictyocaulus viviparus TaxID=29172 RepID=A0A0D8X598_DICVI|nr:hypothetical protein DICVIV_14425 [Dictyocaulus viviparus]
MVMRDQKDQWVNQERTEKKGFVLRIALLTVVYSLYNRQIGSSTTGRREAACYSLHDVHHNFLVRCILIFSVINISYITIISLLLNRV